MKKLLIGALTAGIVLAPLAISSSASAAATDPILAGKRQVVIKPIPSFESIVGIDNKGRLNLTDGEPAYGLFVLSPVGAKWQIKTAKAGDGTKAACIGIKNNGSNPLTAVAATCDTKRAGQLFDITKQTATDNGRPTYAISNAGAFLQYFPRTGLIAEELGDATLETTYSFVDNGAAPVLG
ncbi:hypothetical protein [Winogradskya humida]|uniref:Uncharacterized protein n=1 Tax=Winogradskya humida TaxID=113566 RepID=A0ABQ3ZLW1_9ACTN|nr:hypothetical protein [Actinoplanes humidus]GIE19512.1 hypothetical protein Ahu01nite_026140 [Actinoplanes humidus]